MSPLQQNQSKKSKYIFLYLAIFLIILFFVISIRGYSFEVVLENPVHTTAIAGDVVSEKVAIPPPAIHVDTPDSVKAIYMSACVAATPSFRDSLVSLVDATELNTIVIDVKDFSGTISFDSGLAGDKGDGCRVNDLKDFIQVLHEKEIYTIARVTVFQDPFYANLHPELAVKTKTDKNKVWSDRKGNHFIDVGAKPYWDYVVNIARASYEIGFDEINFDYIRFPSDGNMQDIYFPYSNDEIVADSVNGRANALESFFSFLKNEMDEVGVVTSADLFGMTTTAESSFDLNIGQVLERALPYFDYVAPMVYPSHYPANFNGWKDPNDYPGPLIKFVMQGAVDKVAVLENATTTPATVQEHVSIDQLRPWIQDFDYGGDYDAIDVRAQIDAAYAVGLDSWMLWAPSNRYTREALQEK